MSSTYTPDEETQIIATLKEKDLILVDLEVTPDGHLLASRPILQKYIIPNTEPERTEYITSKIPESDFNHRMTQRELGNISGLSLRNAMMLIARYKSHRETAGTGEYGSIIIRKKDFHLLS